MHAQQHIGKLAYQLGETVQAIRRDALAHGDYLLEADLVEHAIRIAVRIPAEESDKLLKRLEVAADAYAVERRDRTGRLARELHAESGAVLSDLLRLLSKYGIWTWSDGNIADDPGAALKGDDDEAVRVSLK